MGDKKENTPRVPICERRADPESIYAKYVKPQEDKLREAVKSKQRLVVPCRSFVYPQYHGPLVELDNGIVSSVPMKSVFGILKIPRELLLDVYETQVDDYGRVSFTGFFRENGKQTLADLIGTEVLFVKQLGSDSMLDYSSAEIYIPEEKA